jgi:predicted glycosyltransferase
VLEQLYDEVWIYGDPTVYNAVTAYSMPVRLATKCRFTGFLDQSRRVSEGHLATERLLQNLPTGKRLAACVVGGGQDGATLALKFAEGLPTNDYHGVIIGGPLMPPQDLKTIRQVAAQHRHLTVFDFLPEADVLLKRADQVVAMAGYNTVCSLLSFGKPALLAPRVRPRREQAIRADRLAELGLVDTAPLETLTPGEIHNWLLSTSNHPRRPTIDLGGLEAVRNFAARLTSSCRSSSTAVRVAN